MHLVCPFDGLPLHVDAKRVACARGHHFDRAREGYLNLLPVQAKQSKDPGDSALMVQARKRFLATGCYAPIMQGISDLCSERSGGRTDFTVLDAGCGEGAYLRFIADTCCLPAPAFYGLDISKHAVKAAAKMDPARAMHWLVASNRQIPLAAHSVDVIMCAFGFPVWPAFKRVLKPDGCVILADPGPDHLIELRHKLYDDVKTRLVDFSVPDGFTSVTTQTIRQSFATPSADALRDLIAMTPHQHRVPQTVIDQTIATGCPILTLDATVRMVTPS